MLVVYIVHAVIWEMDRRATHQGKHQMPVWDLSQVRMRWTLELLKKVFADKEVRVDDHLDHYLLSYLLILYYGNQIRAKNYERTTFCTWYFGGGWAVL